MRYISSLWETVWREWNLMHGTGHRPRSLSWDVESMDAVFDVQIEFEQISPLQSFVSWIDKVLMPDIGLGSYIASTR